MRKISIGHWFVLCTVVFVSACARESSPAPLVPLSSPPMTIASTAFGHNERISSMYTCDGKNVSPPLLFTDVPNEAKTFALIADDPDAPVGTWVHWLLWNVRPTLTEIPENSVPPGAIEGTTSFKKTGYGGPCPPFGTHRYFFKLYALDVSLDLPPSSGKKELERAMDGHILAKAELIGLYSRK